MTRPHVHPRCLTLLLLLLAACGQPTQTTGPDPGAGHDTGAEETSGAEQGTGAEPATNPGASAPTRTRELAPGATFADLVASLQAVGSDGAGDCILSGANDATTPGRVLAPYHPAMEIGDDARAVDLPALLQQVPSLVVAVRTPHELVWDVEPHVWLVTLTPVSAVFSEANPLAVLVVERDAVRFTGVIRGGSVAERWMTLEGDSLDAFRRRIVPRAAAMAVTAGPDVPVHRVREVLGWLTGMTGEVALAVAMEPADSPHGRPNDDPRDTLAGVDRRNPPPGLCPLGVSDVPPGLQPTQGMQWIFPARRRFEEAMLAACGSALPASSDGGEVQMSMRIMRDGSVREACIMRDPVGDTGLRDCLVREAGALRFDRLPDGDFANVGLGVVFRPRGISLRPLCDP